MLRSYALKFVSGLEDMRSCAVDNAQVIVSNFCPQILHGA